jgi:hypothetical protein
MLKKGSNHVASISKFFTVYLGLSLLPTEWIQLQIGLVIRHPDYSLMADAVFKYG